MLALPALRLDLTSLALRRQADHAVDTWEESTRRLL
jgi:hypothetical protein